jgi:hypothetical protein
LEINKLGAYMLRTFCGKIYTSSPNLQSLLIQALQMYPKRFINLTIIPRYVHI